MTDFRRFMKGKSVPCSLIDRMKNRLLSFVCCLFVTAGMSAQVKWNAEYQAYIDQYKDLAIEEMAEFRIPASITLAQGLLESGAGKSYLSRCGNNHFGIKSHGWTGRTIRHDDDKRQESFRAYDSVRESYQDHSRFLANRERYQRLFSLNITDYVGWANGLKACGYATNPNYAKRLISIIETYKLYEYDQMRPTRQKEQVREAVVETASKRSVYTLHEIKAYNQNYYVYARRGDSFQSIGKEVGVSASNLAKYNELWDEMISPVFVIGTPKFQDRVLISTKSYSLRCSSSIPSILSTACLERA